MISRMGVSGRRPNQTEGAKMANLPKKLLKNFKNWPRKRVTFLRAINLPCLDLILSTFVPNVQIVQIRITGKTLQN